MEQTKVVLDEKGKGQVQLFADDTKAGLMDIKVSGDRLTVYHTEVDAAFEGKGYAKILLKQLVDYARENSLKIIPLCPFVHLQFKRNPDQYNDVWAKD